MEVLSTNLAFLDENFSTNKFSDDFPKAKYLGKGATVPVSSDYNATVFHCCSYTC